MSNTTAIVKTCACGVDYTTEEWERLPFLGPLWVERDEGLPDAELRNCVCGSSIAVMREWLESLADTLPAPRLSGVPPVEAMKLPLLACLLCLTVFW